MENKNYLLILFVICSLFINIPLFSQSAENEKFYTGEQDDRYFEEYTGPSNSQQGTTLSASPNDSGYYLVNTDKGPRFIQHLVWDDSGYVDHYTITIEQYDKRTRKYVVIAENETETNSTEVSLAAGSYRYKIAIYNILGQLEIETEWEEFSIEVAYEPHIQDISPSTVYMEEKPDGNFVISGRNIRSNAAIELRREGRKTGINPEKYEISSHGNRVNLHFDINTIPQGKYNFVITNPGGLTSTSETLSIKYKKPVDFDVSAGYAFNTVLFDDTIPNYFASPVFPIAFALKMTFIPSKTPYGYFGAGILSNYTYMFKEYETYKISGNLINANLNFVYQLPFYINDHHLCFEAFAGGGIAYFMNYQFEFPHNIKSPYKNALAPTVDAGLSLQFYFTNRLFMDFTVPFIYSFTPGMQYGTIVPQLTAGWQF